jgi:hypothetical protein
MKWQEAAELVNKMPFHPPFFAQVSDVAAVVITIRQER